ncbi:hypothetical protein MYP_3573 [Sporocytophaga myxococcoides]|uniref:Uncharacterized protein n=1 Tax=Sporocytophaga myxococcoides TaxID=153721 RepID=A0A098LIR4_9BACT|nr:hypothetical protein MYP_3573 [Sporocytophaga myxococcoides]
MSVMKSLFSVGNHIFAKSVSAELNYNAADNKLYVAPKTGLEYYFATGPFGI